MTPHLVWLASYPKSGNTWLRALLHSYLHGPSDPNEELRLAGLGGLFGSRSAFDAITGIPSAYLTPGDIDGLRAPVWRQVNERAERLRFIKTHDRWRRGAAGEVIFPPEVTVASVIIVRMPLAVAPSWAHHSGLDLDAAIASMARADGGLALSLSGQSDQLPQILGSWSDHVTSWLDQTELPTTLVRYEDLTADPGGTLAEVLGAVGLDPEPARLAEAVAACAFEVLQSREAASGFGERPRRGLAFFRRGQAEAWRDELTPAQVARIVGDHGPTMARLGYELPLQLKG